MNKGFVLRCDCLCLFMISFLSQIQADAYRQILSRMIGFFLQTM